MKLFLLVFGLPGLIVGCGGSSGMSQADAKKYESVQNLLVDLTSDGLNCTNLEPIAKDDRELGQEGALDVADCELDGETMNIAIWKDLGQKKNYLGMAKTIGCEFGKSFGISEIDFVDGGLWTMGEISQTLSEKIASKFEGKVTQFNCD